MDIVRLQGCIIMLLFCLICWVAFIKLVMSFFH